MLATLLVGYPWLAPLAFIALLAAGPALGRWLAPRRSLTLGLLVATVALVCAIVFFPTGRTMAVECTLSWMLPLPTRPEPFANVVLFVPLGYLTALLTRRPVVAAIAAIGASACIEATQALLPALGRSCTTNDLFANALGAIIGAALGAIGLALHRGRAPEQARA
ncbi:VanZ family protein [Leucobacter albus]|uniref:VanZ family protein n=1 Tax=Leucobacter albus TaxID=272210 RepID=A0ABW3TPN1_9MICO